MVSDFFTTTTCDSTDFGWGSGISSLLQLAKSRRGSSKIGK